MAEVSKIHGLVPPFKASASSDFLGRESFLVPIYLSLIKR